MMCPPDEHGNMPYKPNETSLAHFKSFVREIRVLQGQETCSQRKQCPLQLLLKNVVMAASCYALSAFQYIFVPASTTTDQFTDILKVLYNDLGQ